MQKDHLAGGDGGGVQVGDIVEIVKGDDFFKVGTLCRLTREDEDGDWWASFGELGNPADSFNDDIDGIWCIGRLESGFIQQAQGGAT